MPRVGSEHRGAIDQALAAAVRSGAFPGAVLWVGDARADRYHGVFGDAAIIPTTRALSINTIFDVASLTKIVATASAAMLLWERKALELTSPVCQFFPFFTGGGREAITVEHLLNHSSGLPAWAPLYERLRSEEAGGTVPLVGTDLAKERSIELIGELPLEASPGERELYSDLGYMVLGGILEKVCGQALQLFCSAEVFERLGMKHTAFIPLGWRQLGGNSTTIRIQKFFSTGNIAATEDCPWRNRVLTGEVHDDNAYAMGGVAGHAGLFSTARDLATFARAMMDSFHHRDETFLLTSTTRKFLTRPPAPRSFALGWDTPAATNSQAGRNFSSESFGHLGYTGCSLWIDMKRECFVILLTNRVHPSRKNEAIKNVRPAIHDLLFDEGLI